MSLLAKYHKSIEPIKFKLRLTYGWNLLILKRKNQPRVSVGIVIRMAPLDLTLESQIQGHSTEVLYLVKGSLSKCYSVLNTNRKSFTGHLLALLDLILSDITRSNSGDSNFEGLYRK